MAEHISSTLGLQPSSDLVLDVGCDSAMVSRYVAGRCAGLVGVDFIPGMLIDARRHQDGGLPENLRCAAADGRRLPFRARTFAKAYCAGVIHKLPTREDGVAMLRQRVRIALVAALPERVRRLARRLEPWLPRAPLRYLEYDLREIGARLEGQGLACEILDYPPDFRSRDFRETRSSLLISVPPHPDAEG